MIREQERLAAQALASLLAISPPNDDASAGERLRRLGHATDSLVIALQVQWQNGIGDHAETAGRVVAVARDAVALVRQFPAAPSAYPFNRVAWLAYLLNAVFDDDLIAQFPVPGDLSNCRVDYPLVLADACLIHWLRMGTPPARWAAFLAGRLRRKLTSAHLCGTYRAYSRIVGATFAADREAFAAAVGEAERLYATRWRVSYAVPEGGRIMNPKARGRDFRLAALLEFARRAQPEWASACDSSSHRWRAGP